MSRSRYFDVERADGKPANIVDYICAAIMAVIMIVFLVIPYVIVLLTWVALIAAYMHVRYWITGEVPHR